MTGPTTSRALQRVVMDHTPADMIVVDDDSMLPLGRPTITTASMNTPDVQWASIPVSSRPVAWQSCDV